MLTLKRLARVISRLIWITATRKRALPHCVDSRGAAEPAPFPLQTDQFPPSGGIVARHTAGSVCSMSEKQTPPSQAIIGAGLALGLVIGAGAGAAMGDVAVGIALGMSLGIICGVTTHFFMNRSRK